MKIVWILGVLALLGGGGFAVYYALANRVVAFGESQGFKWRVLRVGDLFCPEIKGPTHSGFAAPEFQKLDCHPTIGLAKGEALLAIANSVGVGDEAGPAAVGGFPLIEASLGPGPIDLQQNISGLAPLP